LKSTLQHAISGQNEKVVEILLQNCPQEEKLYNYIVYVDKTYVSALDLAASKGQAAIIKLLIKAFPEEKQTEYLFREKAAFHVAASYNQPEALIALLDACPNDRKLEYFDVVSINADTVLHRAAQSSAITVQHLITARPGNENADNKMQFLRKQNKSGYTALHSAIFHEAGESFKIITTLTSACPDDVSRRAFLSMTTGERQDTVYGVKSGETALHLACVCNSYNAMHALLKAWPDPDKSSFIQIKDHQGQTALHTAAKMERSLILIDLLKTISDPEKQKNCLGIQDNNGNTPLHLAIISENWEALRNILDLWPETEELKFLTIKNIKGETIIDLLFENDKLLYDYQLLPTLYGQRLPKTDHSYSNKIREKEIQAKTTIENELVEYLEKLKKTLNQNSRMHFFYTTIGGEDKIHYDLASSLLNKLQQKSPPLSLKEIFTEEICQICDDTICSVEFNDIIYEAKNSLMREGNQSNPASTPR
jgi:ankyrin repeat protein